MISAYTNTVFYTLGIFSFYKNNLCCFPVLIIFT